MFDKNLSTKNEIGDKAGAEYCGEQGIYVIVRRLEGKC